MWLIAVVLTGATLESFHQPFREPDVQQLGALLGKEPVGSWRMLHILSGACGCSQRVMKHLLDRRALPGILETVVLVEDGTPYLEGSDGMLSELEHAGMQVEHMSADFLNASFGLHGVPLLLIAGPDGSVVYSGGYGEHSDGDVTAWDETRSGRTPHRFAVVGCAVGRHLQQRFDPARLKYARTN